MYYGPFDARNDAVLDWLYGQPWGKQVAYKLSGFPLIGDVVKNYDQTRYINDYLNNRGIDWSDVKYPSMVTGSESTGRMVVNDWKLFEKLYDQ